MTRFRTAIWQVLSGPRAALFVVATGLLLTAPSLFNGLAMDDHFLRAIALGTAPIQRAPYDLYRFIDPAEHGLMVDRGLIPWFSSPELKTAFFRPLASLSVYADYVLLPFAPWFFHVESLALFGALLALVLALYQAVLRSGPPAALAGLLFALDDAHGIPVGWLANRNALFAAAFAVGAVLLHHRKQRWLAPIALALALLSGEVGLGAFAYLVAYALAFDDAPWKRRLASLAPYVVVLIGWWLVSRSMGAGVRASGFYVDPADSPLRFLATFPSRWLVLFLAQFAGPPADAWFVWGGLPLVGLVMLGVVARLLSPLLRENRGARFCAVGQGLTLALSTATIPADRNLLLSGVGAFGLIALFIGELTAPAPPRWADRWLRRLFITFHLVLAPIALPITAVAAGLMDHLLRQTVDPFPADPKQTLVVLNMPNLIVDAFYLATPAVPGEAVPARVRVIAPTDDHVDVTREGDRTALVTLKPGYFADPTVLVVRDPSERFHEGDRVETPGVSFTVVKIDERGRPLAIRCQFDVPLDDPSLRWLEWTGQALTDLHPPP